MKVKLLLLLLLGISVLAFSQVTVIMSADWQLNNTLTGSCYAGCYNPATNHFLVSQVGTTIKIFDAVNGNDTGSTLNMTGVDVTGLGIFGMGATTDGVIYGFAAGPSTLYRWADESPSTTATVAMTGAMFTRTMDVHGTGTNTKLCLCGSGVNNGKIDILGTTDGLTFTVIETLFTDGTGISKNGVAVNDAFDKAWGAPDVSPVPGTPPMHAIKSGGVWAVESTIWLPATQASGSTIMDYDDVVNVLVACNPNPTPRTIIALDGDTGALYASVNDTTAPANQYSSYGGVYIDRAGGKVYYTLRGAGADVNMGRLSYSATLPTKAQDWSVYE